MMMRPTGELSLTTRLRLATESLRQRPLLTALILTLMLAALFGAYTLAQRSDSGRASQQPAATGERGAGEVESDAFLADGYAQLDRENGGSGGTNWWADVPGLMIRLLIVLGLAYGSLRVLNYVMRNGRLGGAQGRALEVVDHLNLGQNRSIYLVRVAGRVLVVGATGNQLNLLSRMAMDDLPEDVRTAAPNFTSQFHSRFLRQLGSVTEDDGQLEQRRQALRELRDEEAVPS